MPTMMINGCQYNYVDSSTGSDVLFWGHGLMYSWQSFAPQIEHFIEQGYRCVAIDWRGQGASSGGGSPEDYSLYQLGTDAATLLDALGTGPVHWVGVSMGAMVAMRLFPQRPDLFRSLIAIDSSAAAAPDLLPTYQQMATTLRQFGALPQLIQALDSEFYTPGFAARQPVLAERWHAYWRSADREALYHAAIPVITRDDISSTVGQITTPTLVVVGSEDRATPPARSAALHAAIAGSELVHIPAAAHMAIIEQADAVTAVLDRWLASQLRANTA